MECQWDSGDKMSIAGESSGLCQLVTLCKCYFVFITVVIIPWTH